MNTNSDRIGIHNRKHRFELALRNLEAGLSSLVMIQETAFCSITLARLCSSVRRLNLLHFSLLLGKVPNLHLRSRSRLQRSNNHVHTLSIQRLHPTVVC